MNHLYMTGDIHADTARFTYKKHPTLRDWDKTDILVCLGDFGLPFGTQAPYYNTQFRKQDIYNLKQLDSHVPCDTIVICGNHEDYDFIETLPRVQRYGGTVRQLIFDNTVYDIYFVDTPQILTLQDMQCLCIPGADSHDIDLLLDPQEEGFTGFCKLYRKQKKWFRIKHWSWWEQEAIDIDSARAVLDSCDMNIIDLVLTHDCPAIFNEKGLLGGPRLRSTKGELFLEEVRQMMNPDCVMLHGHMHVDYDYENCSCLYEDILQIK